MPEPYDDKKQKPSLKEVASNGNSNGKKISELTRRLTEVEKDNVDVRAARKAALNLMEDAILSKEALRKSEELLAIELADSKQLQLISSQIIEEDSIEKLYEQLIDAAIAIMHSKAASIQLYVPKKDALLLLASKGFAKESAAFWEWVGLKSNSTCAGALINKKRFIVQDVELSDFMAATDDLLFYRLSNIRSVQSTPLVSRKGNIVGMISTHWSDVYKPSERELRLLDVLARQAADLLERKHAEEAVRNSEERLRITMETAVDFAIINTNPQGLVESWNSGAEKIFGFKAEEITGKSANIIFTEEDRAANMPEKEMATAREKGRAEDERWHKRKDGSRFYASGVMRPICNPEFTGYVKIARDMTQQKMLDQQKEDFIGIASHELKTPITSIKAYTELLEEICAEGDYASGSSLIKKLGTQVDRLIELVHALLDVSKMGEGELPLQFETFELNALAEERAEDLQRTSDMHRIIIRAKKEIIIHADRERIAQVLTNLISNAIKYSPKGGNITINCRQTKKETEVSVQDEGIGISKEAQEKVFDRFFRVKNAQMYPGMGLGLYITANIIHRHGGSIWVESREDKGSTFYFTLAPGKVMSY